MIHVLLFWTILIYSAEDSQNNVSSTMLLFVIAKLSLPLSLLCRLSRGSLCMERLHGESKEHLCGRLVCSSEVLLLLQTSYFLDKLFKHKKTSVALLRILTRWFM